MTLIIGRWYISVFVVLYFRFSPQGPHLTKLPEGLLQVLSKQLVACNAQCSCTLDLDTLHFAECITKCLIIICRYLRTFHYSKTKYLEKTLSKSFRLEWMFLKCCCAKGKFTPVHEILHELLLTGNS